MPKIITEDMIEQAAIELLVSKYAPLYSHINCKTETPEALPDGTDRSDKKQVVLPQVLLDKLRSLNPDIPEETVKQTAEELCRNAHGDPLEDN
jgi:type I restriction enzyme R subunit